MIIDLTRKLKTAGLTITSALLLCSCDNTATKKTVANNQQPVTNQSWEVFRGSPALPGRVDAEAPKQLKQVWTFKAKESISSSPVIADGTVFIGSDDEHVYALDLESGKEKWAFKTLDVVTAPPLYHQETVYIGSEEGTMYALDAATGKEHWKFVADGQISGGANLITSTEGKALTVFGSYDSNLYCLDAETGKKVWSFETDNYLNGTPAVANNSIVMGGCDRELRVVDAHTGKQCHSVELSSHIAGSAAIEGSIAYVGHYGDEVVAADIAQGKILWTFSDGKDSAAFMAPVAIGESLIYAGCRNNYLYALDKKTGQKKWHFVTKGEVDSAPLLFNNGLLVCSHDGRIYFLDAQTGELQWKYETGAPITAAPAAAQGYLITADEQGTVYCFKVK